MALADTKEVRLLPYKQIVSEPAKQRSLKNQRILFFTCSAFALFALVELIGALLSNSLSLLGDSLSMVIDIFTVIMTVGVLIFICYVLAKKDYTVLLLVLT